MTEFLPQDFFESQRDMAIGQAIVDDDLSQLESLCAAAQLEGDHRLDLNRMHRSDMTFLHFALILDKVEAMKVLLAAGASPHIEVEGFGSVLFAAIRAEDPKYLQALLESGVDPNSRDRHEMPLFFQAATKEDPAALDLLIKHGADLNLTSKTGRPVTLHAFTGLKYDQVEYLINQDVDLSKANNQGVTLAYALESELRLQSADRSTPAYQKLVQLRGMLTDRGVQFPPPNPASLRKK